MLLEVKKVFMMKTIKKKQIKECRMKPHMSS